MNLAVRVGHLALMFAGFVCARDNCGMTQTEIRRLLHFQAWKAHWMGGPPVRPPSANETIGTQRLATVRYGASWLIYSHSHGTVYRLNERSIGSSACRRVDDWLSCLGELRSRGPSSIDDALLGRFGWPLPPIESKKVCTFELREPEADATWRPSPDSRSKRWLIQQLTREVSRAAKDFGTVKRAICGDFNLDDPQIWVVAGLEGSEQGRLLVGVDVDYRHTLQASVVRRIGQNDTAFVQRIEGESLILPFAKQPSGL